MHIDDIKSINTETGITSIINPDLKLYLYRTEKKKSIF